METKPMGCWFAFVAACSGTVALCIVACAVIGVVCLARYAFGG